ncbi:MAG TPA: leucine--tRNA ligase [Polyangiaceae bacterium]
MAYDHRSVEARWQKYWDDHRTFKAERRAGHPKYYVLDMFPYPSGSGLHVGHPEGYTATDIVARYKRMRGFDVLHPMGWDAFGLPAEQHAINTGTHPAQTTAENIAVFRKQLKSLGFAYDWEREVNTTDPDYVRWTQWIFLKLFEKGLAFQAEIPVNWCPALGTVLANEEVIDGRSERGNHPVVRQPLRQWQLKITAYADQLEADLEGLDWPETKRKQVEWIGRSEGAEVDFPVVGREFALTVFTTRPDTLFGATYMVIAPDHAKTAALATAEHEDAVLEYIARTARKSDLERMSAKEKSGVFTGSYARNPLNGQQIPIYTADYVLGAYGTGAIMAVPAHDTRDFEFAQKFGLPVVEVISPDGKQRAELSEAYVGEGKLVHSGPFTGLPALEAKKTITNFLEKQGIGRRHVNYKLRDWVFSRQRYWGEPIPIYFPVDTQGDPTAGDPYTIDYGRPLAVAESELPLRLPELEDYKPGDDPQGPLARALEWRFFQKDGAWFARETNTMPQWAGSCWYYLRYLDPKNTNQAFSEAAYDAWMPVDLYVGGAEHAVLHLLYARFWHKVLFELGVVKHSEPFSKLVHQGMILGISYRWYAVVDPAGNLLEALDGDSDRPQKAGDGELRDSSTGGAVETRWVTESQVEMRDSRPYFPGAGVFVVPIAEKMSKARGNVVNPDEVVEQFGADSLRLYEMFMGPLEQTKPWQTSGIQGCRRFLDRVETIASRPLKDAAPDDETNKLLHRLVKKVGEDIEALRFNTAISAMMTFANHLQAQDNPSRVAIERLLLCLSPFAPHLAEELWDGLDAMREPATIADEPWPDFDPRLCVDDEIELPVQVNGKVRGRIVLRREATEDQARACALADDQIQKFLAAGELQKLVYVPGRILNLIIK